VISVKPLFVARQGDTPVQVDLDCLAGNILGRDIRIDLHIDQCAALFRH